MKIIGHRGSAGTSLENTMTSIREGWASGADGIEIDVHLSLDGKIIVHHDKHTKRLSKQSYRIKKTNAEDLLALPLYDSRYDQDHLHHMPLLSQVLEERPQDKALFIEIKSSERLVPVLKKLLTDFSLENITIISFRSKVIKAVRQSLPSIPAIYLADKPLGKSHNKTPIDLARAIDATGIGLSHVGMTREIARTVKAAKLYFNVWTVNDSDQILPLELLGVDALTTDYPEQFSIDYKKLSHDL